jgi:asparagine synthase (glutamine-hydrolysing)
MPGIVGIIGKIPSEKCKININDMIHIMQHESFYSSGTFFNEQLCTYAGWICHKDSFCDCMPIWNEKKNIALIYFGEDFTDIESINQLKSKNHIFGRDNASYLIHMYEEKGSAFLQDLNGWFSGLLVDLQANKAILFNDRYGMQKIFYHESEDAFYYASEAKALLKILPKLRTLDMKSLGELMSCGCVLENRTLFKNTFLLPVASAWLFEADRAVKKECYFTTDVWEHQPWLEKEFFYNKLKETFLRILPRYFRTYRQIGISLTGGLDTRMFLANQDLAAGKYPCYTFNGMYRDCYDVKVARKVSAVVNQTHHTITVDNNFLSNFATYAEKTVFITDGYLSAGESSELFLNKEARNIAPIRITGNFGSELLRDIRWLKANELNDHIFQNDFRVNVQDSINTLARLKQTIVNPLTFTLFVETPWLGNNRLVSEQSQITLRTPYLDNDLVSIMYRAPMGARNSKELSLRLISDGNPALAAIPTDRGYGGKSIFPISSLAQLYYQFTVKAEYAYSYGMPQWLAHLDYFFKPFHFERLFLGRNKFDHYRIWYRDKLANYVKAILLDNKTLNRPYLNRKAVETIVEDHTKGYGNYTTEITNLITLELIQRLLIET